MNKKIILISMILLLSACINTTPIQIAARPSAWAQPVKMEGFSNLFCVSAPPSSRVLYRSAQPTAEGFLNAFVKLGVTTDVNLFAGQSDKDRLPQGMTEIYIPAHAGHPEFEDAVLLLKAIKAAPGPVLIHCLYGSDRTGWASALFRIVFENWTKEQAIEEMVHGGFGFHGIYGDLPAWIRAVDILKLKKEIGVPDD
jgi:protein-tyrosine phosphatase